MKDFVPSLGRLMDQVCEVLRYYHYAYSTEIRKFFWIVQCVQFNDRPHPVEMGKPVSASTRNKVCSSILFLKRDILKCHPVMSWVRG